MADRGLWWKLWCSALDDPDLDNLDIADFGRYCKIGALVKKHGTGGAIALAPPARSLCAKLQVADFDALLSVLNRLPNVHVRRPDTKCSNGVSTETSVNVSFKNWQLYQGDYSTMRVRKMRAHETAMKRLKRRGEEKRGEEKRGEEKHPPVVPPQGDPAFQQFWTAYPKARQIGKGKAEAAWRKVRPSQALVADILAALERQKAGVRWREDGGRYVPLPATWLNQRRWEDTVTEGPLLSQKTQGNLANLQAFIEANRDPR